MNLMDTAPKDGRFITVHRARGDKHKAQWIEKKFAFRKGKQWVNEDGLFTDVPLNPIIGWSEL